MNRKRWKIKGKKKGGKGESTDQKCFKLKLQFSTKYWINQQKAYNTIDTDTDGIILTSELGNLLRLLGQNPTEAEIQVRIHK